MFAHFYYYYLFYFKFVYSGLLTSQREVAMISEMIHTASLVHDDVIDQSDFRRGKPSVNKVWNHKKVRAIELFIGHCIVLRSLKAIPEFRKHIKVYSENKLRNSDSYKLSAILFNPKASTSCLYFVSAAICTQILLLLFFYCLYFGLNFYRYRFFFENLEISI